MAAPSAGGFVAALENRRFRSLLLWVAAAPLAAGYLWQTLVDPFLDPGFAPKDWWVFMRAAGVLHSGGDIYRDFLTSPIADPTFNRGYIYPPLVAWALQPLLPFQGHLLDAAQVVFQQLCLVGFLAVAFHALGIRDRHRIVLYAILAADLFGVRVSLIGQANLLLLLCCGVWLLGTVRGDRWWAGAALGLGVAVKLLLAPLLVLSVWRRRWWELGAAAATVAVLWLLPGAAPLPEYVTRVLPAVGGGTGFRENQAPLGTIARLLHPASFYGQVGTVPRDAAVTAAIVSLAVIAFTAWTLWRSPSRVRPRPTLEAAAVLAAMPLVLTMQSPSQYITVLVPLLVVLDRALDRRDLRTVAAVGLAWIFLSPLHTAFLAAIAAGVTDERILRPWAELGLAGLALLYAVTMREVALAPARDPGADAAIPPRSPSRSASAAPPRSPLRSR